MGGLGSGRKPDPIKALKDTPIALAGDSIYLPNYSGIKDEVRKTETDVIITDKNIDDYAPSPDLSGLVPYEDATKSVDLGEFNLTSKKLFTEQLGVFNTNPDSALNIGSATYNLGPIYFKIDSAANRARGIQIARAGTTEWYMFTHNDANDGGKKQLRFLSDDGKTIYFNQDGGAEFLNGDFKMYEYESGGFSVLSLADVSDKDFMTIDKDNSFNYLGEDSYGFGTGPAGMDIYDEDDDDWVFVFFGGDVVISSGKKLRIGNTELTEQNLIDLLALL